MSRDYLESPERAPFLYGECEGGVANGVGGGVGSVEGGDAMAGAAPSPPAAPSASLAALRDLQREVGALLRFRDLVVDALPGLRERLLAVAAAAAATDKNDWQIPGATTTIVSRALIDPTTTAAATPGEWTPGVRVRRKLGTSAAASKEKRASGCSDVVQDSGFGTEASSKETHSAGSTAAPQGMATAAASAGGGADELWSLLDTIQRRGAALREEVDAMLTRQRRHSAGGGGSDFQRALFHASADDVRRVRRERDLLLDRLAEMEAEVLAGRLHAARLQDDLEQLIGIKQDLEQQLRAVVSQRGEVNSRIHDLHSQFVAAERSATNEERKARRDSRRRSRSASALDAALGPAELPKVRTPDSAKIGAILREHDPLVLQKHLLTATVQHQVLHEQLEKSSEVEIGLRDKLNKVREENEDLRFQLEDKSIELEGTRARVRLLEDLHQKPKNGSPDIIPNVESSTPERERSRTEISTASMKAMTPLPMLEPSSSTESAHQERRGGGGGGGGPASAGDARPRRPPSRIPLKSYTAPKPPGSAGGPRSRSGGGGSPHRSHSRTRSTADSIGAGATSAAPARSRNSSLVSARDSLTTKLRNSDSLGRKAAAAKDEDRRQWQKDDKVRHKTTSSIWSFFRRDC